MFLADNILKATTEIQIFLTVVTALLIKSEQLPKELVDIYDWVLFVLFILFVPVTFLITITFKLYKMRQALTETHTMHMKHPKAWRAYNKYTLAVSNDQDNSDLLDWASQMQTQHRREREIKEFDARIEGLAHMSNHDHEVPDDSDEELRGSDAVTDIGGGPTPPTTPKKLAAQAPIRADANSIDDDHDDSGE